MNPKARSPFHRKAPGLEVRTLAEEAEILLYDEIGFWGVTAEDFKHELDSISAKTIHLRINSPGGSVFDGLAMFNALKEHDSHIVTHVDGLAASMATVIALAGDEVRMADNAFFMIHDPWVLSIGNATQLRKDADLLDKIGGSVVKTYREKTGATQEQMRAWMEGETWFTGTEALDAGFVDALDHTEDEEDMLAAAAAAYDLSIYAHVPEALARGSETPHEPSRRDLEQALRNAGYARDSAREIAASVRTLQRNAGPEPARDLSTQLYIQDVLASLRSNRERTIHNG